MNYQPPVGTAYSTSVTPAPQPVVGAVEAGFTAEFVAAAWDEVTDCAAAVTHDRAAARRYAFVQWLLFTGRIGEHRVTEQAS